MALRYHNEPIRQWRCATCHPGEAMNEAIQLEPSVKPPGKSAEIAPQMFATHRMIGSMQGILDVAERGVDPVELGYLNTGRATARNDAGMCTNRGHGAKAGQSVGDHCTVRCQVLAGPLCNRCAAESLDGRHAQAQGAAIGRARHGRNKRRLPRRAPTPFAAAPRTAPEGVIDLHRTGQRLNVIALPGPTGRRAWSASALN